MVLWLGLYLDAKTNQYVEEFSTSNFVAISSTGAFVTPDSPTILPSITKKVSCYRQAGREPSIQTAR